MSVVLMAAGEKTSNSKSDKAPAASTAQIRQWIKELGNERFRVREAATRALIKAGPDAIEAVIEASGHIDPEIKQRAHFIIKRFTLHAVPALKKLGADIERDKQGNVTIVSLSGSPIKDADMIYLKGLPRLETIILFRTQITDAGLGQLHNLKKLEYINVADTQVTDEGIKKFKKSLPGCRIYYFRSPKK